MRSIFLACLAFTLPISLALAQNPLGAGAVSGVVVDPSAGVVPDSDIELVNQATGMVRKIVSSSSGRFAAPVLPPGLYTLHVSKDGFEAFEQKGIAVDVGETATVTVFLQLGPASETVTVTGTPPIDSTKTSESALVNSTAIQDLPINGRRFYSFALLTPGVTRDSILGLLSFRGASGNFVNYMVEGNDDNQAYFSENRGRYRTPSTLSANAVEEFQVGTGAYSAEFGRSAAGSVNTVLRSGGNSFHADGFYFYRDQNFDARDPLSTINPTERRQQLGGSISGPIKSNRIFYFVNYDQQIRNFPLVIEDLNDVLDSGKPVLPSNPTAQQLATYNTQLQAFTLGSNFLRSQFPGSEPGNTQSRTMGNNIALGKLDYLLNSSNTFSTFFNYMRSEGVRAIQTPIVLPNVGRNGTDDVRIYAYNARLTSTISPHHVNEFRFQWSRDFEFEFADQLPPETTISIGSNPFSFGQATFLQRPALPDERRLQFVDNFSYITARHAFKFGGEVNRVNDFINNPALFGGQYTYSSALAIGLDLLTPGAKNYTSYAQNFGLYKFSYNTVDYALFAQDQWKPFSRLAVNYGLRWDKTSLPEPFAPNPAVPESQRFPTDNHSFGPRIGLSYDPTGSGKTVLHAGYALYYARIPNGLIADALSETGVLNPTRATIALSLQPTDPNAPVYPNLLPSLPANEILASTVFRIASNFARPRVQDFNFGVEREIGHNLVLAVSYVYTKGDHQEMTLDTNLPSSANFQRTYELPNGTTFTVPFVAGVIRTAAGVTENVNASRPNPDFGAINVNTSLGKSWYHGLLVELRRRYSNGVQLNGSFTWAKAKDLAGNSSGLGAGAEGAFGGGTPADLYNLGWGRGPAPTDQRYRLVTSAVWEPRLRLLRNFRFSGIFTAESGRPIAALVSVPSISFLASDGTEYNGFGGIRGQGSGGDRNLNPAIPRNNIYGNSNFTLDLRVAREFPVRERLRIEILAEGFNILNHSNFNGYQNTIYTATATTATTPLSTPIKLNAVSSWLQPSSDASPPDGSNSRRLQLGLRFRF